MPSSLPHTLARFLAPLLHCALLLPAVFTAQPASAQPDQPAPAQAPRADAPPSDLANTPDPDAAPVLDLPADATSLALTKGLAIERAGTASRRLVNPDSMGLAIVEGRFEPGSPLPRVGEILPSPARMGPPRAWRLAAATDAGIFPREDFAGQTLAFVVRSQADRVMILRAAGHGGVFANGLTRTGDPYAHGYVHTPVHLKTGDNLILLSHAGRGDVRVELVSPAGEVFVNTDDVTTPDALVENADPVQFLGVPLVNATNRPRRVLLQVLAPRPLTDDPPADEPLGALAVAGSVRVDLAPLATLAAAVYISVPAQSEPGTAQELTLRVTDDGVADILHEAKVPRSVQSIHGTHVRTFLSDVDASVQKVAIVPPAEGGQSSTRPALVLSLHGASVEAISQARSYAPKPGILIACPTNRRPFGFDWEDWGRVDALEAMAYVSARFETDPRRVYLTGHSMGGHGTWQLGALFPQRFAAIAPSAGWISFDSYLGSRAPGTRDEPKPGTAPALLEEARASSDTLNFFPNLRGKGIYILHGDADDNVPVTEARAAREELTRLSIQHQFHEEPGAGHWWDLESPAGEPGEAWGAACVDWPPIFAMFAQHTLPEQPEPQAVPAPLDDVGLPLGSFKRAFAHRFVLVYPTGGTPQENAAAYAAALHHADQWWYRGNGRAELLADTDVESRLTSDDLLRRSVILYGNREINRAWPSFVKDFIVSREKCEIQPGVATIAGDDVGVLWLLRDDEQTGAARQVAVVGATSPVGMRGVARLPIFTSGVGVPEVTVIRARKLFAGEGGAVEAARTTGALYVFGE